MKRGRTIDKREGNYPPFPQEALLIDAIPEMRGQRVVCTSLGRAQFAGAAARELPESAVSCTFLDLYRATLATNFWHERPSNLQIECAAEFPSGEADVVALPLSASGEAELARDWIQAGHQRLQPGGKMFASTENASDTWLGERLRKVLAKLERRAAPGGVLYVGTKTDELKKVKNFSCEFAFRDRGRLIHGFSRPGVFSHRGIDLGARALIDEMQIAPATRVLEIGCGAGVVSLAAAFRDETIRVHAVDSNARAIECTRRGVEMNGLTNVTTELNAEGGYHGAGQFDIVLANPPYYSAFEIARRFLVAAHDALREQGKILIVTRRPDWYQENMSEWYSHVIVTKRRGYALVHGVRARQPSRVR